MMTQIRSELPKLLLTFGVAFVTVILLRAVIYGGHFIQSLPQAFVVALSISLGLAWIERPRHPRN